MSGPAYPGWAALLPKERHRIVTHLLEVDHRTYDEAAALLGVSRSTIAGAYYRAREAGATVEGRAAPAERREPMPDAQFIETWAERKARRQREAQQ